MIDDRRSNCPIACTLDLIGDRWTLLVLRDLFLGKHRYEEFLDSPERIATNILSERLKRLRSLGMIDVRVCDADHRRKLYELTARGRSFAPVLSSLVRWGLEHIENTVRFERVPGPVPRG